MWGFFLKSVFEHPIQDINSNVLLQKGFFVETGFFRNAQMNLPADHQVVA